MFSEKANKIFKQVIDKYHVVNTVDQPFENPYSNEDELLEHLLYRKCWIDTVQWHYEDIIRDPNIEPVAALDLKRKIDASNQDRTDMVEYIDSYFLKKFSRKDRKFINNKIELLTKYFSLIFENKSLLLTKISLEQDSGI